MFTRWRPTTLFKASVSGWQHGMTPCHVSGYLCKVPQILMKQLRYALAQAIRWLEPSLQQMKQSAAHCRAAGYYQSCCEYKNGCIIAQ